MSEENEDYRTWSKPSLIHEYNKLKSKAEDLDKIDYNFALMVRKQMEQIYKVLKARAINEIANIKVDDWLNCEKTTKGES